MAYVKQNFVSGAKLFASQLNAMDDQIEKNAQDADEMRINTYSVGPGMDYVGLTECLRALKDDEHSKRIDLYEGTYDILEEMGGQEFLDSLTGKEKWYEIFPAVPPNTEIVGHGRVEITMKLPETASESALDKLSPVTMMGSAKLKNLTIRCDTGYACVRAQVAGIRDFSGFAQGSLRASRPTGAVWEIENCTLEYSKDILVLGGGGTCCIDVELRSGVELHMRNCMCKSRAFEHPGDSIKITNQAIASALSPRVCIEDCAIDGDINMSSYTPPGANPFTVVDVKIENSNLANVVHKEALEETSEGLCVDCYRVTYINTPHTSSSYNIANLIPDVVYDNLDKKKSVLYTAQELTDAQKEQARKNIGAADAAVVGALIDRADRSLDALWKLNQGISYQFEADDAEAYQKIVPSGAKCANVNAIGGKTICWNQQINPNIDSKTDKGVTATRLTDNSFVVSGTPEDGNAFINLNYSGNSNKCNLIAGHKYCMLHYNTNRNVWLYLINSGGTPSPVCSTNTYSAGAVFTCETVGTASWVRIQTSNLVTSDASATLYPMLVDLTQMGLADVIDSVDDFKALFPTPNALYNPGELVSAEVKSVDVISHITDVEQGTIYTSGTLADSQTRCRTKDFISVKPGVQYSLKFAGNANANAQLRGVIEYDYDKNYIRGYARGDNLFTPSETAHYVKFMLGIIGNANCIPADFGVLYIDNPITYPIPTAIRELPGYGWSAGAVYNGIERTETGWQYVQRVGSMDLGVINWTYRTDDTYPFFVSEQYRVELAKTIKPKCKKYSAIQAMSGTEFGLIDSDKALCMGSVTNAGVIKIRDTTYTDVAAFKASLSGVMLYYELTDPIITDITELMGVALDAITVEAGGTLTLENAAALPVPNTIEYAVSLAEVNA